MTFKYNKLLAIVFYIFALLFAVIFMGSWSLRRAEIPRYDEASQVAAHSVGRARNIVVLFQNSPTPISEVVQHPDIPIVLISPQIQEIPRHEVLHLINMADLVEKHGVIHHASLVEAAQLVFAIAPTSHLDERQQQLLAELHYDILGNASIIERLDLRLPVMYRIYKSLGVL